MSKNINKNDWLTILNLMRSKLRNANGIKLTGMSAMNEINNFILLALCENFIKEQKLPKHCQFSYLVKEFASDEKISEDGSINKIQDKNCFKLWDMVYNSNNNDNAFRHISKNKFFKSFISKVNVTIFSQLKSTQYSICESIQYIFNKIYKTISNSKLDNNSYDDFSDAYEQFKNNTIGSSIKKDGQHFTPSSVKEYIINELKPKATELFYEPCCGTGGFIHTSCNFVKQNESSKLDIFKKNIYANEIDTDVINFLMINVILHGISMENILDCDSLGNENCNKYINKFDIIATNPPFGKCNDIKKNSSHSSYWDPVSNSLGKITRKGSYLFLVHSYNSLKKGGRAGIVVDRGLCNDGKNFQVTFRKWLLDNTNLDRIVLLPTGIFPYTNFASCILFFVKGQKTKDIKYYEGKISENKKLVVGKEPFKTVQYEQIKDNNWNLDVNLVNGTQDTLLKSEFVSVKLGDIIQMSRGDVLKKDDMRGSTYNVIGGGIKYIDGVKYDKFNVIENTIIVSNDGCHAGYVNMFSDKLFITNHCLKVQCCESVDTKYAYYVLKFLQSKLMTHENFGGFQKGNSQLSLNYDLLAKKVKFPLTSPSHQKEIVNFLNNLFNAKESNIDNFSIMVNDINIFKLLIERKYDNFEILTTYLNIISNKIKNYDNKKKTLVLSSINKVCSLIYSSFDNFVQLIQLLIRVIDSDKEYDLFDQDKENIFSLSVFATKHEAAKLGDLIESEISNKHKYKYINYIDISAIENSKIKESSIKKISSDYPKRATRVIMKNDIIISSIRPNYKKLAIIDVNENNLICSNAFYVVRCKENCYYKFLYEFLKSSKVTNYLVCNMKGSTIPKFTEEILHNIVVHVPSFSDQNKIVEEIEKISKRQVEHKKYWTEMKIKFECLLNNLTEQYFIPIKQTTPLSDCVSIEPKKKVKKLVEKAKISDDSGDESDLL